MSWKAGDIAIYVGPVNWPDAKNIMRTGDEVLLIRQFPNYHNLDGEILNAWKIDRKYPDGENLLVAERFLRKKRPPEQPSAFSYHEIIALCNEDLRPTETQVREGNNVPSL